MTYELCKQLQSAGWTYKDGSRAVGETCTPTLSELIEACGDGFINLTRDYSGWCTNFVAGINDESYDGYETYGSTPEEAVANLWLELNKK